MGACDDQLYLDGKLTETQVEKAFKDYQSICAEESGNSYSGRLNMCRGLEFGASDIFKSESAAYAYVSITAKKWGPAVAVRYMENASINLKDKKLQNLQAKLSKAQSSIRALERKVAENIDARLHLVEFVKCNNCRSVLDTRFRSKGLDCPVCGADFAPATAKRRFRSLEAKAATVQQELDRQLSILQTKANSKGRNVEWLVFGVCSS